MTLEVPLIADSGVLDQWLQRWSAAPWLALDTEFVRETTYYPKPCLLQVDDGTQPACIDLIAMEGSALAPLFERLARADTIKVFHSASQDLELFVQLTGDCPRPLFDTQIAATLLGEGDQLGYAALVERKLGLKLDKSLTRTDWSRRPLSGAELSYAADDVRHLARIYPPLREALAAAGRLGWLEEECARLTEAARYLARPEDAWRRLKGLGRLEPAAHPAAVALAAWRERTAQQRNRPRKWVLEDDALYRLAERRPRTAAELAALAVLPPKTLERNGDALLQILAGTGAQAAPAVRDLGPLEGAEKARFQRMQDWVRTHAERLALPASLLAPRAELEALARDPAAEVLLKRGWRAEVLGAAP